MGAAAATNNGASRAVPLTNAVFCVNCENVSSSPHDACAICGSHSLISLSRMLGGTLRSQKAQSAGDYAKYSLALSAKVHGIPATDLNLLIELLTRLVEMGGTVESLHLNVEPVSGSEGVLKAA
jgi:hypothetical protein